MIYIAFALGALLPASPVAAADSDVPALIKALRDRKPEIRAQAAEALVKAGPAAVPALVAEMKVLRWRQVMRNVLQRIGPRAVPPLFELMKDESLAPDAASSLTLVIGPESAERVPALLDCLEKPVLANSCGRALIMAAPKAQGHASALLKALKDSDSMARVFAAAALGEARPRSALEPLAAALNDREPAVRAAAASALGKYGSKAKSAVPLLRALEKDPDAEVRVAAAEALRNING